MATASVMPQVAVVGVRALRRDLKRMIPGAERLVTDVLRESVQPVAAAARARAADFSDQIPQSLRGVAYAGSASIRSLLPQAGVWEFGGIIEPRGAPIQIEGQHYILQGFEDKGSETERILVREFGDYARRYGWHGP